MVRTTVVYNIYAQVQRTKQQKLKKSEELLLVTLRFARDKEYHCVDCILSLYQRVTFLPLL
jgi:hypothetical protein